MAADQSTVTKRVTEIINACLPGTFVSQVAQSNLNRNALAIAESVREGALMIGRAILANPSHVHRNAFISGTPTAVTHAGELPDMAGEGDLIEIEPYSGGTYITGTPKTVQQIESYRANPSSLYSALSHTTQNSPLSGYYAIKNGRVYFTGNAARGYFPQITRAGILSIIPDEYESTWVCLGVGLAVKIGEPELIPVANHYMQIGVADLSAITEMGVIQKLPTRLQSRNERGDNI